MSPVAASPQAYRESSVLSAPPEALVVMLYDGALRFLFQAAVAMRDKQIETTHRKLRRAEDIILHLRDALDMEQGEIAERLHAIYMFCLRHLRQARLDQDPGKVEQVRRLLSELREAWATISQQ
jgi:flagellar protein FliS